MPLGALQPAKNNKVDIFKKHCYNSVLILIAYFTFCKTIYTWFGGGVIV